MSLIYIKFVNYEINFKKGGFYVVDGCKAG